jgi:uncharacterized protein
MGAGACCRVAILKIASRCNLNCSYCYMYNLADKSYLEQPSVISKKTADAFARRLAQHCALHRPRNVVIILHGGEPLLAGRRRIQYLVDQVRHEFNIAAAETEVIFSVQTNAALITQQWCDLFISYGLKVGVSIDGVEAVHDQHRVDHFGEGSYSDAIRGWRLLQANGLSPSVLTVIDASSDPEETFRHTMWLQPSRADFLLPECTHDNPPPGISAGSLATPYADWLIRLFDHWVAAGSPFRIITFEYIARKVLGAAGTYDALGPDKNPNLIFETDGSIEPVDVLKACKHGMTKTEFNVHSHSIDECFKDPLIDLYYRAGEGACDHCQRCTLFEICGGGYLPHRFKSETLFDNPSVYCRDLEKLICYIQNWVLDALPPEVRAASNLEYAFYLEEIDRTKPPSASENGRPSLIC